MVGEKSKMCQGEILKILEKENRWMSSKEIKERLPEIGSGSINSSLSKLFKSKDVFRKEIKIDYIRMYSWRARE